MGYELIEVREPADWAAYHVIRRQELFEAKGRFGIYNPDHPDEYVPQAHPYLLKLDGVPIGTTRLDVREDGVAIFRMVAITASAQGRGHGRDHGAIGRRPRRGFWRHHALCERRGNRAGVLPRHWVG
ncbi:hypothetical protein N8D56_13645 [Devosia sp. A8/3-2]|nr:hypothetical protein N8D56_13645 [Devosia sp. A8/3-2]